MDMGHVPLKSYPKLTALWYYNLARMSPYPIAKAFWNWLICRVGLSEKAAKHSKYGFKNLQNIPSIDCEYYINLWWCPHWNRHFGIFRYIPTDHWPQSGLAPQMRPEAGAKGRLMSWSLRGWSKWRPNDYYISIIIAVIACYSSYSSTVDDESCPNTLAGMDWNGGSNCKWRTKRGRFREQRCQKNNFNE
jgi:hypothetical protein